MLLSLSAVWLHWFSCKEILLLIPDDRFASTTADAQKVLSSEFKRIEDRTIRYRAAWALAVCSLLLIVTHLVVIVNQS